MSRENVEIVRRMFAAFTVRWTKGVGDRVLVWVHQRQVGSVSGIPFEFSLAWDFLFRDGKVARIAFFRVVDHGESFAEKQKSPP